MVSSVRCDIIQLLTCGLGELSLFQVDISLCLQKLKSITVLLYDFSFVNENFATFTFVVPSTFYLRHLRTF